MSITFISSVNVDNAYGTRTINLYSGDLAQMAPANYVDYLIVSALPGDYTPTPDSLIGALSAQGVSVQALSQNKAASFEPATPCWVSQPVSTSNPNVQFGRIVMFEPASPATAAAPAIASAFQAISCFQGGAGSATAALPLLCTGTGGADPTQIMTWTFYSAATAASTAFPFNTVNIVVYSQSLIGPMTTLFAQLASSYTNVTTLNLPGNYSSYAAGAWNAAQNIPRPPGMTVRQVFGVYLYTTNYYQTLNPPLYGGNITDPTYVALMPVYQCVDAGLAVLGGFAGNTYRGEQSMTPARIAQYQPGNVVLHLAYTSTSSVAGGWFQGSPYKFVIAGTTGRPVASFSQYPSESEVLYRRNMTDRCSTASCNSGQSSCTFTTVEVNTNPCSSTVAAATSLALKVM